MNGEGRKIKPRIDGSGNDISVADGITGTYEHSVPLTKDISLGVSGEFVLITIKGRLFKEKWRVLCRAINRLRTDSQGRRIPLRGDGLSLSLSGDVLVFHLEEGVYHPCKNWRVIQGTLERLRLGSFEE